jgi:hypothetical protein
MGFVVLLVALTLSAVAAWYSVAGLMVLFAAAAIPVAIMASTLEIAKLVTASWLYNNWRRIPWALKTYLVFSVLVLMFVTSLGIFGFLSKAHLDQAMPVGDIATKIEIIDEKIKAEQANIESAKVLLKQMDDAVNQALGRGAGNLPANATAAQQQAANTAAERNTNQSAALRKNQQKERDVQFGLITKAQANIQKLREERAPIASQARTLEAEVGPIKYVAEIIWGGDAKNHFDSAVRFLIITLIFVFDPLAVLLVIASNMTFTWYSDDKQNDIRPSKIKEEVVHKPATITPFNLTPDITSKVYEVDSNIKMDFSKFVSSPLMHSHSFLSNVDIDMVNKATPPSLTHALESDAKMEKTVSVDAEVDIYTNTAIIEEVKIVNDLEKVYEQIVEEKTKSDAIDSIDDTDEIVQELDEGLHRHSGGGTPPGSWMPPPAKKRRQL